jgi:hypothetical protein
MNKNEKMINIKKGAVMFNAILEVIKNKDAVGPCNFEFTIYETSGMDIRRCDVLAHGSSDKGFIEGMLLELMQHFTLNEIKKLYKNMNNNRVEDYQWSKFAEKFHKARETHHASVFGKDITVCGVPWSHYVSMGANPTYVNCPECLKKM